MLEHLVDPIPFLLFVVLFTLFSGFLIGRDRRRDSRGDLVYGIGILSGAIALTSTVAVILLRGNWSLGLLALTLEWIYFGVSFVHGLLGRQGASLGELNEQRTEPIAEPSRERVRDASARLEAHQGKPVALQGAVTADDPSGEG